MRYAQLLISRGRFAEAELHWREILAFARRAYTSANPATLTAVLILAHVVKQQGRLDEAEALYREALAGQQLALGAAHADTQDTAAKLDSLLRAKAAAAQRAARRA